MYEAQGKTVFQGFYNEILYMILRRQTKDLHKSDKHSTTDARF